MFKRVEEMKPKLDKSRLLNSMELNRLREELLIDFIYNSNAI